MLCQLSYAGRLEDCSVLAWAFTKRSHAGTSVDVMRRVLVLGAVVLAAAGCRNDERSRPLPAKPVSFLEIRAVIDDWYVDGIFNDVHRCAAVRAAITRLPSHTPAYSTYRHDFRMYEQRACSGG
jgi:hypothetical protein